MKKSQLTDAYEGRVGADRIALRLGIIPHPVKGDMYEVKKLRAALLKADARIAELEEKIVAHEVPDEEFREWNGGHA